MASTKAVAEQLKKIYELVLDEKTTNIWLYGVSGIGKTWSARKIADRAVRHRKFDVALWIYPETFHADCLSTLLESIDYQLRFVSFPSKDEPETDKDDNEEIIMMDDRTSKKMKRERDLKVIIGKKLTAKKVLFILAAHDDPQKRYDIEGNLKHVLKLVKSYKVLTLCRTTRTETGPSDVGIMPLSEVDLETLRSLKMAGAKDDVKELATFFINNKTPHLPSEVITIAKTVSSLGKTDSGLQKLRYIKHQIEQKDESCNMKSLTSGYEIIPRSILVDCYSSETSEEHFLNQRGMVYYNELISYWILEGHLGHFTSIEDAYDEGHRVAMDLLECGFLKKMEGSGYVLLNKAKKILNSDSNTLDYYDFFKNVRLGLATTFDNKLGTNVAVAEGTMRTVCSKKDKGKMGIFLLDGNRPISEDTLQSFNSPDNVEVVGIFNPTKYKQFPLPIFQMTKLRLLVIRGCQFLEGILDIFKPILVDKKNPDNLLAPGTKLNSLTVFEVSGPSLLKIFPPNFFETMPNLKSLNLSFLEIEVLPISFYGLKQVEVLILRGCSKLKEVKSLRNLEKLQVLDLSGAILLENFEDKSFCKNNELEILNLSKSKITRLPSLHSLQKLKSLTLSDCAHLPRMCMMRRLKLLQILDISGAEKVKEFIDLSLEKLKSLKLLDVSRTSIRELPHNVSSPQFLYLRSCYKIKELYPIEGLDKVEVLDLSGSYNLEKIHPDFFQNMKCLRELNLSKTGLKKLENLSSLEGIEVLDVSGCQNLMELADGLFDHQMGRTLRSLDVSGTHLVRLPSLSQLVKLKKLYIRFCPNLTSAPGIESIRGRLEVCDETGTDLSTNSDFNPSCLLKDLDADNCDFPNVQSGMDQSEGSSSKQSETTPLQNREPVWSISNWRSDKLSEPVKGVHFIQLLNTSASLLTKNFNNKFHFFVYPKGTKEELPKEFDQELSLREILHLKDKVSRCLEIRGFTDPPSSLQPLIKQVEFVCLADNPFLRLLNDLDLDSFKDMRACWIERCNEMEHVFSDIDEVLISEKMKNLEILRVSDVMKLSSICKGITFNGLKSLYLEYCPNLSVICSSSSQLKNLDILEIRYCQALKNLFEDESAAKLENLTKLTLWGLLEVKKIDCRLPKLNVLRVGECPLVEEIEVEGNGKLEVLEIKFCDSFRRLRTNSESQHEGDPETVCLPELQELEMWGLREMKAIEFAAPKLNSLRIVECDMLENVIGVSNNTSNKLKILQVKACEKLKTIFHGDRLEFNDIETMELICLPELTRIGYELQKDKRVVWGCPKLLAETSLPQSRPVNGQVNAELTPNWPRFRRSAGTNV